MNYQRLKNKSNIKTDSYFRFAYVITLICLLSVVGYSSPASNETEDFQIKAKTAIVELTYAFMQDFELAYKKNETPLSEKEQSGMKTFSNRFLLDNTDIDLSSIDEFLKKKENGWSNNCYKVFSRLKDNYRAEIENNSLAIKNVIVIHDSLRKLNFETVGAVLISDNWDAVHVKYSTTATSEINTSRRGKRNNKPIVENDETQPDDIIRHALFGITFKTLFYIFLIISILQASYNILGFLLRRKWKRDEIIAKNQLGQNNAKDDIDYYSENNKKKIIMELENEVKKLKRHIELSQKNDINKQPKKTEKDSNQFNKETTQENNSNENTVEPSLANTGSFGIDTGRESDPNEKNITYYRVPDSKGAFLVSDATLSPDKKSYYQIEADGHFGVLKYRSGDLDRSAINQRQTRLMPVCTVDGLQISFPTRIDVIDDGKVELINDKWIIKEKIKLKLV